MGEHDLPASGPPASFSVNLASSAVTLAGSVDKSKGLCEGHSGDGLASTLSTW